MANTGKIVAALIGIGVVGYTVYDYTTTGTFWWDKIIMRVKAPTQAQLQAQAQIQARNRQLVLAQQRKAAEDAKPVSKYIVEGNVSRGSQPTQNFGQMW